MMRAISILLCAAIIIGFCILGPLLRHALVESEALNRSHSNGAGHSLSKAFLVSPMGGPLPGRLQKVAEPHVPPAASFGRSSSISSFKPIELQNNVPNLPQQNLRRSKIRMSDVTISLGTLDGDIFTLLCAFVLVTPIARRLNLTPVLLFLAFGWAIGPYGFGFFSDSEADLQLGDFGIVFLLFLEGLQLSQDRLEKLGSFGKLGAAQIFSTIVVIAASNLLLGPPLLAFLRPFLPLDETIVRLIVTSPVTATVLAFAGALSSSAFVLPVLKQKGWEDREEGTAALSVLLLQDIIVAPLLVILPLLAGSGPQSAPEWALLLFKSTFGFFAVLKFCSVALRQIFGIVARANSSETFLATAMLVAIGIGAAAEELGLSTTTGAFAAGVLLAGSEYRQQIEADIEPFKGILLGIFFITAGASLDPTLCLQEWPTLIGGIVSFLAVKVGLLFPLGIIFGLTPAEAIRIGILLSGGGEFAFVIFKLAEQLDLIEAKLSSLLTASVIISMSLTPLLAELAEYSGDGVDRIEARKARKAAYDEAYAKADELFDMIDPDGNGSITMEELRSSLIGGSGTAAVTTMDNDSLSKLFAILDLDGDGMISRGKLRAGYANLILGEIPSAVPQSATGDELATAPDAVVVCGYGEVGQAVCDVLADAEGVGGGANAVEMRDSTAIPSVARGTQFIAFDRNPSRVSLGLTKPVRVVYGDGASPKLLQTVGIRQPRKIVVTYDGDKRCLEATRRLREAFPETPIFVHARTPLEVEPLLQAGATEVVVDSVESTVRIASLLDTGVEARDSLLRRASIPTSPGTSSAQQDTSSSQRPPYPEEQLESLAAECDITLAQVCNLYDGFSSFELNNNGEVELGAIRDILMRVGAGSIEEDNFATWMAAADRNGDNAISFFEYVRMDAQLDMQMTNICSRPSSTSTCGVDADLAAEIAAASADRIRRSGGQS